MFCFSWKTKRKERTRQTTLEPVYMTVLRGHITTLYSRGVQDGSHLFGIRYKNNNATMSLQSKNSAENPSSKLSHQTAMGDLNAQDVHYLSHANGASMNG